MNPIPFITTGDALVTIAGELRATAEARAVLLPLGNFMVQGWIPQGDTSLKPMLLAIDAGAIATVMQAETDRQDRSQVKTHRARLSLALYVGTPDLPLVLRGVYPGESTVGAVSDLASNATGLEGTLALVAQADNEPDLEGLNFLNAIALARPTGQVHNGVPVFRPFKLLAACLTSSAVVPAPITLANSTPQNPMLRPGESTNIPTFDHISPVQANELFQIHVAGLERARDLSYLDAVATAKALHPVLFKRSIAGGTSATETDSKLTLANERAPVATRELCDALGLNSQTGGDEFNIAWKAHKKDGGTLEKPNKIAIWKALVAFQRGFMGMNTPDAIVRDEVKKKHPNAFPKATDVPVEQYDKFFNKDGSLK